MEQISDEEGQRTSPERQIFTLSVGSYITHYQIKKGTLLLFIIFGAIFIGAILLSLPSRAAFAATGILIFTGLLAIYPYLGLFTQIWLYFKPFSIYGGPGFLRPIFLVTFLTLIFFLLRFIAQKKHKIKIPMEGKLILVFFAFTVLSFFFAVHSSELSFTRNITFLKIIVFFFLIINLIDSHRKLDFFVWFIVFCCALEAWEAIRVHQFYGIVRVDSVGGVQGTSGGLSTTLVMILPLVFYKIYSRNIYVKAIALILVPIMILGTILAGSRGGTLGLAAVILLLLWRFRRKSITWLVLAVVILAAVAMAPGEFWDRTMTILHYQEDGSAMGRIQLWEAGFEMFTDHPLTGIGQGNFEWVSPQYTNQRYYQAWLGKGFAAHNVFIQLLAEGGIQALLGFLLVMGITFRNLRRVRRDLPFSSAGDNLKGLSYAVEIGLIGFLVCGFFISREGTDILYWMLSLGPVIYYLTDRERSKAGDHLSRTVS